MKKSYSRYLSKWRVTTPARRQEEDMKRNRIQKRLNAYKTILSGMTGLENRRRWTQRVLADIERTALTVNEKVMLRNAVIKAYEQI